MLEAYYPCDRLTFAIVYICTCDILNSNRFILFQSLHKYIFEIINMKCNKARLRYSVTYKFYRAVKNNCI